MLVKRGEIVKVIYGFCLSLIVTHSPVALAYDPFDCLSELAEIDSEINIGLGTRLCSGAWTPDPVVCYRNVSKIDSDISRGSAIDLCAGSVSSEMTLQCYSKAAIGKMARGLATTLCGTRKPLN